MMTFCTLKLENITRRDAATAGAKGANLGELAANGFPVPPGFVVSAGVCESFFKSIELSRDFTQFTAKNPDQIKKHCASIQRRIEKTPIPLEVSRDILLAYDELIEHRGNEVLCVVRSSATSEDLADASFAGQHATYYFVDRPMLLIMIKHCWASLWRPEAVCYRFTRGIDHGSVFMAVVVQEMIRSEVSGVTFTANPVSGSRNEIVTESGWGMGAAIVDGRVTPDHYMVDRDGFNLREKRIAEKWFMVPPQLKAGSTTRLQEVPYGMRQKETLSPDLIQEVSLWAVKAEGHFGCPQDVEWAVSDGRFYMLQSRPITVMGPQDIRLGVKGCYVIFKPMVENFTDPLTPLTQDFCQLLFAPPLFRMIKGWLYLNAGALRRMLPFKLSDENLAALLYGFGKKPPEMKLSLVKLPLFLWVLFFTYLMFGVFLARTRKLPVGFMDGFRKLSKEVEDDPDLDLFETTVHLLARTKIFDPAGNQVMLVNLSAVRYFFSIGLLENLLQRWAPDLKQDAASLLCSGSEGMLSAEMGREMWDLAKEARQCRAVQDLLGSHRPENVLPKLRSEPEAKDFLEHLDRFLAKNGHRGLKELELRSPRWEENPAPVLGMIRNHMLTETNAAEHEKKVNQTRKELIETIQEKLNTYPLELHLGLRWRVIRHLANRTKYFSRMRENSRFYHTLGFYGIRKKILRIEEELIRRGKLKCKDDIFFLHLKEIEGMQSGTVGWRDVEDRIRQRRMEHIRLSKMSPPKSIGTDMKERSNAELQHIEEGVSFRGQPASGGSYEGIARIMLDPSVDAALKPGEVLVAPYMDPAWTPLFLTAGAAVVEVGSYLSHAGTVAREFGMPCVVDLPDCTRHIQTGFRIYVDGDQGLVTIISKGEKK